MKVTNQEEHFYGELIFDVHWNNRFYICKNKFKNIFSVLKLIFLNKIKLK